MKNKLISKVINVKTKIKESAPALVATAVIGASMMQNVAFAAADAAKLFEYIVKGLGGIVIAGAAIRAVMGLSAYTDAKSEGEGPEMSKAKNQISASIMGIVFGIALEGGASGIGNMIDKITFGS